MSSMHPISLTTVDQSGVEMGSLAATLLLERIQGRIEPVSTLITPRLVVRSTTAPPPGQGTARVNQQKELGSVPE